MAFPGVLGTLTIDVNGVGAATEASTLQTIGPGRHTMLGDFWLTPDPYITLRSGHQLPDGARSASICRSGGTCGGIVMASRATGMAPRVIGSGLKELDAIEVRGGPEGAEPPAWSAPVELVQIGDGEDVVTLSWAGPLTLRALGP